MAADSVDRSDKPARLTSLDAYRGAIMLLMASGGLAIPEIARHFPDSRVWALAGYHCEHAPWRGCTFWDLIQPAFMFMVGVAVPWSLANRRARGASFAAMLGHALWRAVLLVLLAVFLSSAWSGQTNWSFTNVLAQIGLGYPLLFLLAFVSNRTLWLVAGGVLLAYWLAFALYPLPASDFDWSTVGVPADWHHLEGFSAHWEKNANFAAAVDRWFLNLFPRSEKFVYEAGGYQTLNFVPSLATMIFGLMAGRLMRTDPSMQGKLLRIAVASVMGVVLGYALDRVGICPIVKRIWTPAWVLYSTGWVALMLAGFVAVIDWAGWKRWSFPLVVVGLNPITIYVLWQLSGGFIKKHIRIHFGSDVFASLGVTWTPMLERGVVLIVLWLIAWWMYRRKIFVRI